MTLLPKPHDLGAPAKFQDWRYGQDIALNRLLDSTKRFAAHAMPTGSGKSLVALVWPLLTGMRAIYLTSTKGLQRQLMEDFAADTGLVSVSGMTNYPCRALLENAWPDQLQYWRMTHPVGVDPSVEDGPCHGGGVCGYKDNGCGYYDAVRVARRSRLVVTNYSFWMSTNKWSEGLGDFDCMILDEAHEVPDELSSFLRVELRNWDLDILGGPRFPKDATLSIWKDWASPLCMLADRKASELFGILGKKREYKRMQDIARRLEVLKGMKEDWIPEPLSDGFSFEPKWPAGYAETSLFLDTPKVLLMSATIRPKTMTLLGIPPAESEFFEYPSPFPAGRRPVIHVPTCRVNFRTTPGEMRYLAARVDQIISGRMDRKGIILPVSYDRAKFIYLNSEHHDFMFLPTSKTTRDVVEQFKTAQAPAVLVSPAVDTGWDFPYEACEYVIIVKLAFPDTRSLVMSARADEDKDYPAYLAMTKLVQGSGRGMRAADDLCETIIVDDNIGWFMARHGHFAPDWFKRAMSRRETIPAPPPKLVRAG